MPRRCLAIEAKAISSMAGRDRSLTRQRAKRGIIRVIAFIGIFILLYCGMTAVFNNHPDFRILQSVGGFYEEPAGSLHGVYIGSSNVYAFWNALVAWKNYGLAIYPYTCPSMPFYATEYIMRDVRKTQPDAMFIVNVNHLDFDDMGIAYIHHILSYMPESENKAALRDHLCDLLGLSWSERLEFYFPWVRMRQYWTEYLDEGILPRLDGLKGASHYDNFLSGVFSIQRRYRKTEKRAPLSDNQRECIEHLLDYCDAEEVRVVFVCVPRGERTAESLGRINTACDIIRQRGHSVLYLTDQVDAVNLDLTQDFYEIKHTNIHGAIKFTDFLSEYLIDAYGLEDKRSDAGYESWNEGWERYREIIAPWVLDFEMEVGQRDYALAIPRGVKVSAGEDGAVKLRWNPVDGADAYCVYLKAGKDAAWQKVSMSEECAYEDAATDLSADCRYTVVPVRRSGGKLLYGNFTVSGMSVSR